MSSVCVPAQFDPLDRASSLFMICTIHFLQRNWRVYYHGIYYHKVFLIFWWVLCFVALFYICLIMFPTWDSHIVFLYVAAVWAGGGFAVPTGWFAPHSLDTSIAWCTRETDRCGQASGSRRQVAPHESTEQSWLNKVPARDEWHWHSKYTHLCYRLVYFINSLWLVYTQNPVLTSTLVSNTWIMNDFNCVL